MRFKLIVLAVVLALGFALPVQASTPVLMEVVIRGYVVGEPETITYAFRGFPDRIPRIGELYKFQLGKFRFAQRFSERVVDVQHGGTSPQLLIILKSAEGCCLDWFSRWGDRTQ